MMAVITAEILGLISIFSAVTMTEATMCRLIVIADLSVVLRHTPAEVVVAAAVMAEAATAAVIDDELQNSPDKN